MKHLTKKQSYWQAPWHASRPLKFPYDLAHARWYIISFNHNSIDLWTDYNIIKTICHISVGQRGNWFVYQVASR